MKAVSRFQLSALLAPRFDAIEAASTPAQVAETLLGLANQAQRMIDGGGFEPAADKLIVIVSKSEAQRRRILAGVPVARVKMEVERLRKRFIEDGNAVSLTVSVNPHEAAETVANNPRRRW